MLKVAGTKCREGAAVLKSRILNVTNVANDASIFLNFVPILTKYREKSKVAKMFSIKSEKVVSRKVTGIIFLKIPHF